MTETGDGTIWIRFYAELNDRLPAEQRFQTFPRSLSTNTTVSSVIEQVGIRLSEIDLVLVNSVSVDSSYALKHGDRVSVYPVFESFDITPVTKLREKPLRQPRFVLDVHLGKLAYFLRMLGFDTLYRNDFQDKELITIASDERRVLLSKDRELLSDPLVTRGYHVRAKHPREQLNEVLERFDLFHSVAPLQRCLRCNSVLEPVDKAIVRHLLPPAVEESFNEFQRCPGCDRVYWKGSHYVRMNDFVHDVLNHQKASGDRRSLHFQCFAFAWQHQKKHRHIPPRAP